MNSVLVVDVDTTVDVVQAVPNAMLDVVSLDVIAIISVVIVTHDVSVKVVVQCSTMIVPF